MATETASEQIDRQLAAQALEKRRAGKQPTHQEQRALKRVETAREEELREQYYRTIPKRHYCEMSGRPHKVLHDQADLYGLPLRGKTLDLYAILRAFHDLLKANKHRLSATEGEDPMSGTTSPALERWREEKFLLARLDRLSREEILLPREQLHERLGRMAGILRKLGETMQRHHGAEPYQLVMEALDDWDRELESLFLNGNSNTDKASL